MRSVLRVIDSISEWTGRSVRWVCVALILVFVYEVTARYVFTAPTIWAHQTVIMLNGTFAAIGFAYVLRHQGHIRVDIIYSHLSERGKAFIDVLCTFFLFFPLVLVLIYVAADYALVAWIDSEVLTQSFWYPPAGPIRTVIFLALCLFLLQGVAQFTRDFCVLVKKRVL